MKFTVPDFLSLPLAKSVVFAGRILPINTVKGTALLMATAMGDVANVRRLTKKIRPEALPLSLQHAILSESVNNIVLLGSWKPKKTVNRPKQSEALETFNSVTAVQWSITGSDIRNFLDQLLSNDLKKLQTVDVAALIVQLCTRQQWSADTKRSAFSQLCAQLRHQEDNTRFEPTNTFPNWALDDIYAAWRMELSADCLVPVLPARHLSFQNRHKSEPQTVLQHCVRGATDKVLLSMLNDCISPQLLNKCSSLFDRPNLTEDVLYAFIKKGMDVQEVLKNKYYNRKSHPSLEQLEHELADDSSHAIETLKSVQRRIAAENQKSVLIEAIEEVAEEDTNRVPTFRRKM